MMVLITVVKDGVNNLEKKLQNRDDKVIFTGGHLSLAVVFEDQS